MLGQQAFFASAARHLADWKLLDRRGAILYSGLHTLQPGRYYLLGFNPGGETDDLNASTLDQDLQTLALGRETNAYLDERWSNPVPGRAPFQKRVQSLASILNLELRDLCASNLIFMKSKRAHEVTYPGEAKACWPVHASILGIVKPKVILAIGNGPRSAYRFLRDGQVPAITEAVDLESTPSGYSRWRLKAFKGRMDATELTVIGLPHFSYYPVDSQNYGTTVRHWLLPLLGLPCL